jgi:hypothetical protein
MALSVQQARAEILSLEDAATAPHVDREAFRARGTVFATLRADGLLNVKLPPEGQALRCEAAPAIFSPVAGGWGRMGFTTINLDHADLADLRSALLAAWTLSRAKLKSPKRRSPQ